MNRFRFLFKSKSWFYQLYRNSLNCRDFFKWFLFNLVLKAKWQNLLFSVRFFLVFFLFCLFAFFYLLLNLFFSCCFVVFTVATISCVLGQYQYSSNQYSSNIFNGCDYYETIELGRVYDVFSPYYPDNYPPGTNCRWSGCAPAGTNIVIKCTDVQIPTVCEHLNNLLLNY